MGLFGKKQQPVASSQAAGLQVKVLGSGCAKCKALERNVQRAIEESGIAASLEHVTDFGKIAAYGVMVTPALVIDGKVVSSGHLLEPKDIIPLLQAANGAHPTQA